MRTPEQILQPDMMVAQDLSRSPGIKNPSKYANHYASSVVLLDVMDAIGATKYQLGRLLGLANPDNVYHYFNGRKRPAQFVLARAIELLILERAGVQFALVRSVDWELGEIRWRNGSVTAGQCWPGEAPGKKKVTFKSMGTFKPRLPVSTNGIAH